MCSTGMLDSQHFYVPDSPEINYKYAVSTRLAEKHIHVHVSGVETRGAPGDGASLCSRVKLFTAIIQLCVN